MKAYLPVGRGNLSFTNWRRDLGYVLSVPMFPPQCASLWQGENTSAATAPTLQFVTKERYSRLALGDHFSDGVRSGAPRGLLWVETRRSGPPAVYCPVEVGHPPRQRYDPYVMNNYFTGRAVDTSR